MLLLNQSATTAPSTANSTRINTATSSISAARRRLFRLLIVFLLRSRPERRLPFSENIILSDFNTEPAGAQQMQTVFSIAFKEKLCYAVAISGREKKR
jgi:hypothetical protein|nr:hypothetical protein [Oscillospiraceae bacterium]